MKMDMKYGLEKFFINKGTTTTTIIQTTTRTNNNRKSPSKSYKTSVLIIQIIVGFAGEGGGFNVLLQLPQYDHMYKSQQYDYRHHHNNHLPSGCDGHHLAHRPCNMVEAVADIDY